MDIEGKNLYFLYEYFVGDEKFQLDALDGTKIPFFLDKWHDKYQVIYFWHSKGGSLVKSDFEYLYRLRDEYGGEADFWFVNLAGADRKEKRNAKAFAEKNGLNLNSILLDKWGEAAATFSLLNYSAIAFVKKDNYVYKKLEGNFDEGQVRKTIDSMLKAPLHRD